MTATLHSKARPTARTRAVLSLGATAATGAVWVTARGLGADLTANGRAVTLPAVIITTVLVALAAWALLAILERTTRRAATAWSWTAVAVLVLSLTGPIGGAETAGGGAALVAMHLAAAAVLIPGLRRTATTR